MIEKIMSLNHFTYKKPFSGSDKGNRFHYVIRMVEEEIKPQDGADEADASEKKPEKIRLFSVTCWAGEGNSIVTPDEDKTTRKFEFSEAGYEELISWLNRESDKID